MSIQSPQFDLSAAAKLIAELQQYPAPDGHRMTLAEEKEFAHESERLRQLAFLDGYDIGVRSFIGDWPSDDTGRRITECSVNLMRAARTAQANPFLNGVVQNKIMTAISMASTGFNVGNAASEANYITEKKFVAKWREEMKKRYDSDTRLLALVGRIEAAQELKAAQGQGPALVVPPEEPNGGSSGGSGSNHKRARAASDDGVAADGGSA
jgi:hypothetical protein